MNFTLQVTGVVEDPKNSHLDFEFLMNYDLRDDSGYIIMREGFVSAYGYYRLTDEVDPIVLTERTKAFTLQIGQNVTVSKLFLPNEQRHSHWINTVTVQRI